MIFMAPKRKIVFLYFSLLLPWIGCTSSGVPKPHGYMRLEYPNPTYQIYQDMDIPVKFLKSKYISIQKLRPHWANAKYVIMPAEIHITYTPVKRNLHLLLREVQKITYDHTIKADAIGETPFVNPKEKVYGMLYDLTGESASALQFYVTDSTHHMISGSLYFRTEPNPDSLAPAVRYIREDLMRLIESLEWTQKSAH